MGWLDRLGAATLALCLADLGLVALTLWASLDYRNNVNARNDGRKTLQALDGALLALVDAETGQRGYIISGDDRFLEPYQSGLARLDSQLSNLRADVKGNPEQEAQFESLQPVVRQRVDQLAQTLALRTAPQELLQAALSNGKRLMDDVRARIAVMRSSADVAVGDRERRTESLNRILAVASIGVAVLTVIIVGALTYTTRRRAETEALRQAAEAKDEFVGFVSHELRGPIAVIAGNARRLAAHSQTDLDDEGAAAVAEISQGAGRLEAIVGTLLNLAKAESGQMLQVEPVLIHRLVANVLIHHKYRHPGREVRLEVPHGTPAVMADRDAIEQVVLNLLSNAERYGSAEEPISIRVEPDNKTVTVSVVNAGRRLDPGQFERVFEPFFRSRGGPAGGVGLGLTVCQRLVVAQGGSMVAEALPEGGACFSFRLAVAPEDGEESGALDPSELTASQET